MRKAKVAICMSGDLRQFKRCYPRFKKHVLKGCDFDYDIFMSSWQKPVPHFKRHQPPDGSIEEFEKLYKPKEVRFRPYAFKTRRKLYKATRLKEFQESLKCKAKHKGNKCRYCCGDLIHNIIGMFWNIKVAHSLIGDRKYDYVIRTRPDNYHYTPLRKELFDVDDSQIMISAGFDGIVSHAQPKALGINDQFALGTPKAMAIYSNIFDHLYDLATYCIKTHGFHGLPLVAIEEHMKNNSLEVIRGDFRHCVFRKKELFETRGGLTRTPEEYRQLSF